MSLKSERRQANLSSQVLKFFQVKKSKEFPLLSFPGYGIGKS
jgi:hypothetical protein